MQSRLVTVILNRTAGAEKKGALRGRLVEILKEHGIQVEIRVVQGGSEITKLVKSAVRNGSFALAAGGGDGTVNAVASGLIDSECAPGVLPVGTFNHFAKDLQIPLDVERATQTIATGDLLPTYVDDEMAVFGLNSTRSFTTKHGKLRERDIACVREKLMQLPHRIPQRHASSLRRCGRDKHLLVYLFASLVAKSALMEQRSTCSCLVRRS
jgi:hypothetical protein